MIFLLPLHPCWGQLNWSMPEYQCPWWQSYRYGKWTLILLGWFSQNHPNRAFWTVPGWIVHFRFESNRWKQQWILRIIKEISTGVINLSTLIDIHRMEELGQVFLVDFHLAYLLEHCKAWCYRMMFVPSIISSREIIPLPFVSRLMNSYFRSCTSFSGMKVAMYKRMVFLILSLS